MAIHKEDLQNSDLREKLYDFAIGFQDFLQDNKYKLKTRHKKILVIMYSDSLLESFEKQNNQFI